VRLSTCVQLSAHAKVSDDEKSIVHGSKLVALVLIKTVGNRFPDEGVICGSTGTTSNGFTALGKGVSLPM